MSAVPAATPEPAARAPAPPGPHPATARDLLSLRTLPPATWRLLLEWAEILSGPEGRAPRLAGARVGALFLDPSLRTRTAFEVACHDLGAHPVVLASGQGSWALEWRQGVIMDGERPEHLKDAVGVLSGMVDALGVRAFAQLDDADEDAREPVLSVVTAAARVPVLNLESAIDHPHQGLADALTVRRRFGGERVRVVVRWAPHKKPLPRAVPHAALLAFAHEGHDVVLAHPEGYELDAGVLASARALARAAGGSLAVSHERDASLAGARVVYAKSWGAAHLYGRRQLAERDLLARRDWIVDAAAMARTERAVFMHCLPVRRGLVVADEVIDGPDSLVLSQAHARLPVQKATLCHALGVTPCRT